MEKRYCKKCHKELSEVDGKLYCKRCKRARKEKIENNLKKFGKSLAVFGAVGTVVIKKFLDSKHNNSNSDNS